MVVTRGVLGVVLAAVCALAITAATGLAETARAVSVSVTGPEEMVWDWSTTRCDDFDNPDGPAVAFRDATNRVQLIAPSGENHRMVGPDLDHLTRDCTTLLASHYDSNPAHFDDVSWMNGIYTQNGQDVYALVHSEFHAYERPETCPTRRVTRCLLTGVTFAVSHDGGNTYYTPAPPDNLVAVVAPRLTLDLARTGLYSPSVPIKKGNFYYSFTIIQSPDPQETGVCAMRTSDITDPQSWRGWDGTSFGLRFRNPYYESVNPAATHSCEPISRDNILEMERSVIYNTALGKYVMVGISVKFDPASSRYVHGFYFTTSDDLVHWSMRQLLMETATVTTHQCGGPDPLAYPSLIDPASTDRNFRVTGAGLYLYYVRIHYDAACNQSLARDLLRIPIRFSP